MTDAERAALERAKWYEVKPGGFWRCDTEALKPANAVRLARQLVAEAKLRHGGSWCATCGQRVEHPEKIRTCTWADDGCGCWETTCGNAFEFSDGGPKENHATFCCYCGKPIDEVPADD